MLQLIYDIYTYIAKARFSFCAHTDRCDAVNQSIFRIFRSIYMQRNHTQSDNSALFTRWAHIRHTHIYCKGTTQLLRTFRQTWCSKSIDFRIFRPIYTQRNHTQSSNSTLFTRWAYIQHTHIYCEGTTQLLHVYTSAWCSKSIDFSLYQIDLHASQSHTLQRHDTVFANIHRTTATSWRMRCNSYTSHTYTLRRHDSAFAHLHACMMQ